MGCVWADGLSGKAGLEDSQAARLVVIGALTAGRQVVRAVEIGQRESKEPWGAALRGLRARGLKPLRCTVGVGHLGIGLRSPSRSRRPPSSGVRTISSSVRLRTTAGKRHTRVDNATALIWKRLQVAEQHFRRLHAPELLPLVYAGVLFVDGKKQTTVAHEEVAV